MASVPLDDTVGPLTTPQQVKRSLAGSGGHGSIGLISGNSSASMSTTSLNVNSDKNANEEVKVVASSNNVKLGPRSEESQQQQQQQQIQAYAMLDFDSFTFYVQTMQIILGRMVDGDGGSDSLDIHLGSQKAISRRHAKIFYNFGNQRFELSVLGRNGAFVDDAFVEKGVTVPLHDGSKVQIGETGFIFELPNKGPKKDKKEFISKPREPEKEKEKTKEKEPETKKKEEPESVVIDKQKKRLPSITEADILAIADVSDSKPPIAPQPAKEIDIEKEIEKVLADHNMEVEEDKEAKFNKDLAQALHKSIEKHNAADEKKANNKSKKSTKPKKKVYELHEIPPQYREKPALSYSTLITECLRLRSTERGMSLSEIYKAIQDLYPYYFYAPDGWQSSVRHNLSLNKSFRKISKEGKGWLWGLNEEVIAEKERQKEKQLENAKAKVKNIQAQQIAKANQKIVTMPPSSTSTLNMSNYNPNTQHSIQQPQQQMRVQPQSKTVNTINNTPAPSATVNDNTKRALAYLQKELIQLTKNRYSMYDKETTTEILTQALAMTINQVGQAAKSAGIKGSPLVTLIDKNPQHITKILTAALNAATLQVTRKKGLPNNLKPKSVTNQSQSHTQQQQQSQQPSQQPPQVANQQQPMAQMQQQTQQSQLSQAQQPNNSQASLVQQSNAPIKTMINSNSSNLTSNQNSTQKPITIIKSEPVKPASVVNEGVTVKQMHPIRLQHPIKTQGGSNIITSNKPMIHTFTKPMQFSKPVTTSTSATKIKPLKPPVELSSIGSNNTKSPTPVATEENSATALTSKASASGENGANGKPNQVDVGSANNGSSSSAGDTPGNVSSGGVAKPQFYSKKRPIPVNKPYDSNKPFANVNISKHDEDLDSMIGDTKKGEAEGESFAKMLDSFISDNSSALNGVLNDKKRSHDEAQDDQTQEPKSKIVKIE